MLRACAFLGLAALIAGCSTPRQRCEAQVTHDIAVLDRLIAETEATIARGYAIEVERVPYTQATGCWGWGRPPGWGGDPGFCTRTATRTERREVAVDLDVERAKLASMRDDRARRAAAAGPALAACAARYPDPAAAAPPISSAAITHQPGLAPAIDAAASRARDASE
jgi:hypothetical protein